MADWPDLATTPNIVDTCLTRPVPALSRVEATAVSEEFARFGGCPMPGYTVTVPVVSVDGLTNAEYIERIIEG